MDLYCYIQSCILFFLLNATVAYGQPLQLEKVEAPAPYPAGRITALKMDADGYLWIGSGAGLYRFDGYRYHAYRHSPADPNSLSDDLITAIATDRKGNVWIATAGGGLNRFDRKLDHFERFLPDSTAANAIGDVALSALLVDREDRVWIGHRKGVDRITVQGESAEIRHYRKFRDPNGTLERAGISGLTQDSLGQIWAGISSDAIYCLNDDTIDTPWYQLHLHPTDSFTLHFRHIYSIATTPDGRLVVAMNGGLHIVRDDGKGLQNPEIRIVPIERMETDRNRRATYMALFESPSKVLIVTVSGLHEWNPQTDALRTSTLAAAGAASSGLNVTYTACRDRSGDLWVGAQEGLYRSKAAHPNFRLITPAGESVPTSVTAAFVDEYGQHWLGVEDDGIAIADADGEVYLHVRNDPNDDRSLNENYILSIQPIGDEGMYVGTYGGGLHRAQYTRDAQGRISDLRFARLQAGPEEDGCRERNVYDIAETTDGFFWAVGFTWLHLRHPDGQWERVHVRVGHQILEDRQGRIWIPTELGLYRARHSPLRIERYAGPADLPFDPGTNYARCIAQTEDSALWVGSRFGLLRLPENGHSAILLRHPEGLADHDIRALRTAGSELWIASQSALHRLNPATMKLRRFDRSDGLPAKAFTSRSDCDSPDGRLHFGTAQGLLSLQPDSLNAAEFAPPVHLTDFFLFNQRVPIQSADTMDGFHLPAHISQLETLSLRYRDKVFGIEFAATDFRQAQQLEYRFKMEGFDPDWRSTDARNRTVTYTNLDPGSYTFRVRVRNRDELESPHEARLRIEIAPPWWRTTWARIGYVLLLAGLVYLVVRLRLRAVRRKLAMRARIVEARAEERDRVRAVSARDFHDEAGNKLTKLALYLALLRHQEHSGTEEVLENMDRNVRELSSGMRDFIWVLDPRHDDLAALLLRLKHFGEELFGAADIDFRFSNAMREAPDFVPDVRFKRHLLLIFKEAMHNAVRHADCRQVSFEVRENGAQLEFALQDDGKGFDEAGLQRQNGLQNMRNRAAEIGAELRVEAQAGTRIVLRISIV